MGGGTSVLGNGEDSSPRCSHSFLFTRTFFMSVPAKDVSFEDGMNVFFSALPLIVIIVFLVSFAVRRTTRRLVLASFLPVTTLINKILALSLTGCEYCARPVTTCLEGDGMPSGHSSNAYALLMWLLLETFAGWGWRWPAWKKLISFCCCSALLGPIPYSRVYLGDHTEFQVLVGAWEGVCFGVVWFLFLQHYAGSKLGDICNWKGAKRIDLRDTYWGAQKASVAEWKDKDGNPSFSLPLGNDPYPQFPPHTHHDLATIHY